MCTEYIHILTITARFGNGCAPECLCSDSESMYNIFSITMHKEYLCLQSWKSLN